MSVFGGAWHVLAWREDDYDEYNGVDINDFNGGDAAELIVSATPRTAIGLALQGLADVGHANLESVDLATFHDPGPARFHASELHIDVVDERGQHLLLIITPAREVSDSVNGFDMRLRCV